MSINLENVSILRQCVTLEKYFLNNPLSNKNLLFSVSIETEIDLNERLDIVDKALYEWKLMHPFLRCSVINRVTESSFETYFVSADESKIKNSFTNVKLLYLDNSRIKKEEDELFNQTWQLIAEKELTTPIECFNGELLWRLTFFSLKENQNKSSHKKFKFNVLLFANHSILDGRSTYSCLIHLFQIMENIYQNSFERQEPYKLFPGRDFYSKDFIPEYQSDYFKVPKIEIPSFYNKNLESHNDFDTNLEYFKEILDEIIFYNNGADYLSLKELIENSKNNFSKFSIFSYDQVKSKLFIDKCKKHNVKVNSCIKNIFSIAIEMLHSKFGDNLETIVFILPFDLRSHFIKKYGPEDFQTLSFFITAFLIKNEASFNENMILNDEWVEKFWSKVKDDDDIFQKMIKEEEFLKIPHLDMNTNPNKMKYHFNLTNYGVLPSKTEKNTFNIQEFDALMAFPSKDATATPIVVFTNTIQNKMSFTIRYNAALIDKCIIESFLKIVDAIYSKI